MFYVKINSNAFCACQTLSQQTVEQQRRVLNEVKELLQGVDAGILDIMTQVMSRALQRQVNDHPQKFSDEIKQRVATDFSLPEH